MASLRHWIARSDLLGVVPSDKNVNLLKRWWKFRRVHGRFGWKFWAFVSGGATLDTQTENFWHGLGFAVLQGYGMTETASLISVTHPFKPSSGSIGKLMPGYEVNLEQGGEIVVRGPSVSPGTGHLKARRFEQPNNGCTPVTLERSTIREIYTSRAALKMSSSLLPD
jgi:long-chain acyl-CoA synthetase